MCVCVCVCVCVKNLPLYSFWYSEFHVSQPSENLNLLRSKRVKPFSNIFIKETCCIYINLSMYIFRCMNIE